jgi:hypothetical protein
MRGSTKSLRILGSVLRGLTLLVPAPVLAQSCSLCYTQAASATARFIQALRSGILVLIIPPVFLYAGISILAYRKRRHFRQDDPPDDSDTRS